VAGARAADVYAGPVDGVLDGCGAAAGECGSVLHSVLAVVLGHHSLRQARQHGGSALPLAETSGSYNYVVLPSTT